MNEQEKQIKPEVLIFRLPSPEQIESMSEQQKEEWTYEMAYLPPSLFLKMQNLRAQVEELELNLACIKAERDIAEYNTKNFHAFIEAFDVVEASERRLAAKLEKILTAPEFAPHLKLIGSSLVDEIKAVLEQRPEVERRPDR